MGACELMIALKCGGIMLLSRRNWAARARPIELLRLRRVVRRRCERRIDLEASAQGQKNPRPFRPGAVDSNASMRGLCAPRMVSVPASLRNCNGVSLKRGATIAPMNIPAVDE
jgi:hypothetical protein